MKKITICLLFLLISTYSNAQTQTDSLRQADEFQQYLFKNREAVKSIVDFYSTFFGWWQLGSGLLAIGLAWQFFLKEKLNAYLKQKAVEAIESMSDLKTRPILILSSPTASTEFLDSFFEAKRFTKTSFLAIEDKELPTKDGFKYDVVFANNDDGNLNLETVKKYVKDRNVLFYFGKPGSWRFGDSPDIDRKTNLANSRAQIYGNLMSSLEFLELIKPKIKNN